MENNVFVKAFQKVGKNIWEEIWCCSDPVTVYGDLSRDLTNKYINKVGYIKSIRRINPYTGYIRIIVMYDNGIKRVYNVKP